jgi:predicted ester cyclase
MSIEQNKRTARHFFAAQDQHKGPLDEAICAPNYTAAIAGFPVMDRTGHSHFGAAFYQGFPDLSHTIETTIGEGDQVTVHFTLQGTHRGDFMGVAPTDKPITVSAIAILRFVEGKVTQLQAVFDQMGLMRQLGLLPT